LRKLARRVVHPYASSRAAATKPRRRRNANVPEDGKVPGMKSKTGRAARKAGARAQPKPPFPKQHQTPPGLESKLIPTSPARFCR